MRYTVQTVANGTLTNNMHVFRGKIEDLLGMLGAEDPNAQTQQIPAPDVSDPFQMFKQFVHDYVQEHDELPEDHPIIQQIHNFNTVDEIEKILRQNLDYCDDCILTLFRKFATGNVQEPDGACGCGGD